MESFLRKSKSFRSQQGLSNISVMITVLIGGILIAGGVQMIRMIDEVKADYDLTDLADYKKKIVSLGAAMGTFPDGQTEAYLNSSGLFAASMVSQSLPIIISNRWGGKITAKSSTTPGIVTPSGVNDGFTFSYSGVPATACKKLAIQAASIADSVTVQKTVVKNTVKSGGTGVTDEQLAISKCDSAKDNATMTFVISKY